MLRKIRIVAAALFFIAVTMLFLDFTGTIHRYLGWMAKIQFLPAVFALNFGIVAVLVVLTFLFGRIYCSVICPLGVFQDIISWINGSRKKKNRFRFSFSPAKNWLRYGILALFIAAVIAGIHSFVALLAPYSAYGRIVNNIFSPVYKWGNNLLAYMAERLDSYTFYASDVWIKSLPTFIIAAASLIVIFILAWRGGRTYCNTICPVGSILGLISRFSLFAPVIDTEKCRNCGLCSKRCKASCINMKAHEIDYSRCVACMDCIDTCSENAIKYKYRFPAKKKAKAAEPVADTGRRAFMTSALTVAAAATVRAQEMKVDGGLAEIQKKKIPERTVPLKPFGASGLQAFSSSCTACQLCVSVCPNKVLRPSASLLTLMQPEMSFEDGYCRPECTRCSEVCPTGAIRPVTPEIKSSIQIGHAVITYGNCLAYSETASCGNCARHCPSGALSMVHKIPGDKNSAMIPVVNEERCTGCGACEHLCPARPFSAIIVQGHEVHKLI